MSLLQQHQAPTSLIANPTLQLIRDDTYSNNAPRHSKAHTAEQAATQFITRNGAHLDKPVSDPATKQGLIDLFALMDTTQAKIIGDLIDQKAGFKNADGSTIKNPKDGTLGDFNKVLTDPEGTTPHYKDRQVMVVTNTDSNDDPQKSQTHIVKNSQSGNTTLIASNKHLHEDLLNNIKAGLSNAGTSIKHVFRRANEAADTSIDKLIADGGSSGGFNATFFWLTAIVIFILIIWAFAGGNGDDKPYQGRYTSGRNQDMQRQHDIARSNIAIAEQNLNAAKSALQY